MTSPEQSKEKTSTFYLSVGENSPQSSLDLQGMSPKSRTTNTLTVNLSTVNALLKERGISHVDLLSIDTEGTEIDVLEGTDLHGLNVKLLLIEDWGRDLSLHRYLKKQGFRLVRRTGFNSWYVPKETNFPLFLIGRLQLFRKLVLGMPFRRFRHWRHERVMA